MIIKKFGIGAGVAVAAVAGMVGYRHFLQTGARPADAANVESSRVISLGKNAAPRADPGKVLISPVMPRQPMPRVADTGSKPIATQPAARAIPAGPAALSPAVQLKPSRPPTTARPSIQPAKPKSSQPKKARVISIGGSPASTNEASAPASPASALTVQEKIALELKGIGALAPMDKERYLLNVLTVVRTQIARYAHAHNGRPPEFLKYPAFEQLMKPTLPNGRIVDDSVATDVRDVRQVIPPCIRSMPINALNGNYRVAVVPGSVQPGQKIERPDAGFVFCVATNEFFATNASGFVYDEAAARAKHIPVDAGGIGALNLSDHSTIAAIQSLRGQLALYKLQHQDKLPDFKRLKWEQLTSKTRADGKVDASGPFGPYLFKTPINSRNSSSEIDVVQKLPKTYTPRTPVGYVFEASTGRIWLTDEIGNIMTDQ